MRIGIVCPYSFDVPGGVQNHVRDLAETLIGLGHEVSVLAPADEDARAAAVRGAGRAGGAGAVQRLGGPARVRADLGRPGAALAGARATSTCCTCTSRSRRACRCWRCCPSRRPGGGDLPHRDDPLPRAGTPAQGVLQLVLEKITARIAVSALARKVQVEHLGGGAWRSPTGWRWRGSPRPQPLPGWPGEGGALGFLGRFTEPRKGFPVLRDGVRRARPRSGPGCGCWWPGRATPTRLLDDVPADVRERIDVPRHGLRGGQGAGCCAASTSTSRRTPAASRSA